MHGRCVAECIELNQVSSWSFSYIRYPMCKPQDQTSALLAAIAMRRFASATHHSDALLALFSFSSVS